MVAIVGFAVQALVTRTGPVTNLTNHLAGAQTGLRRVGLFLLGCWGTVARLEPARERLGTLQRWNACEAGCCVRNMCEVLNTLR